MKYMVQMIIFLWGISLAQEPTSYRISEFGKGARFIPPSENNIIQGLSGSGLTEVKIFPTELKAGEVVMRVRYSCTDYRLYHGKFSSGAFDVSNKLFSFEFTQGKNVSQAVQCKYYKEEAVNPDADESIIYFDQSRIYAKFLPSLLYNEGDIWKTIDAANISKDQKKSQPLGDIAVVSNPTGAKIFIDGEDKSIVTPNYVTGLFAGSHRIKASLADYLDGEKSVDVKAGDVTYVSIDLQSALGTVEVTSTPAGATVVLGNLEVGVTPIILKRLKPGSYTVNLSFDLYKPQSRQVMVTIGKNDLVNIALEPNFGTLQLPKPPIETLFTVDGITVSASSIRLNPGKHQVAWNGGDLYSSVDTIVTIRLNATTELTRSPSRLTGSLKILPIPLDAEVFVNDKNYGVGPKTIADIPTGSYTVSGKKTGSQTTRANATVTNGATETVRLSLEQIPDRDGDDIEDANDKSPDVAGSGENDGCRESPVPDGMVSIPGGTFMMGSNKGYGGVKPVHQVTVSGFYMDKTEVTQVEYERVMGTNPSYFKKCPTCPVENVSWNDVQVYCEKVGKRLPTEAEWEYAARAGSTTKYYWGDEMDGQYTWYDLNSNIKTHQVAQKKPNKFSLYDMSGNVWEWCGDWYDKKYYKSNIQIDPKGPSSGGYRIIRGGSWRFNGNFLGSAFRFRSAPNYHLNYLGFRCVKSR